MPSHAIKGYYVMADLIEVRPTNPRPPSPHRQGGSAAPPWATPCRAGLCRATLCWAGLVWPGLDWRHVSPSTAMHLQLAASPFIDFWRRRRRRSTNPVFGRVALRCVLGYSLDPVACNDDSDDEEGRTTTWVQLLQRLWLLSQILTHLATRFSAPDCNPNTSAPIPTATFHPLRLCMLAYGEHCSFKGGCLKVGYSIHIYDHAMK